MKFTVVGTPIPQGSLKAFMPKGWTRPVLTADNKKTKPWRQLVAVACQRELRGDLPAGNGVPMRVELEFYFDRPQSVKKWADKTTKPDIDKLARSILDALTGVAFEDDSQVTELRCVKAFGSPARVEIVVEEALPPAVRLAPVQEALPLPF